MQRGQDDEGLENELDHGLVDGFIGNGAHVYVQVDGHREEGEAPPEDEKSEKERDPLASSSEEDPMKEARIMDFISEGTLVPSRARSMQLRLLPTGSSTIKH